MTIAVISVTLKPDPEKISNSCHISPSKNKYQGFFALLPVSENEVIQAIKELKSNSFPGYEEITANLVKLVAPYITEILLDIFNSSFNL